MLIMLYPPLNQNIVSMIPQFRGISQYKGHLDHKRQLTAKGKFSDFCFDNHKTNFSKIMLIKLMMLETQFLVCSSIKINDSGL